jgi:hypothetical protein
VIEPMAARQVTTGGSGTKRTVVVTPRISARAAA